jgi:hypothetical protein
MLSQWQIDVGDHILVAQVRADVDVMKEHRKVASFFARVRQPVFIKVDSRLVAVAGAHISRERAAVAGDDLVDDAEGVRADIAID